ncbi:hypothetical protein D9758_003408 [Tetrapyrgos nigripes]|uniref:Uncharacterized protein n=1 Tax=Tetrapyrgos nigripes TaxID=182062 RepID=A0A8H5LWA6_9AGAR|nr:hypothetical protein D9758_003408 [Tetrapyrgos nigripes]
MCPSLYLISGNSQSLSSFSYWLPLFLKHKYVALRFLNQAAYECTAPLDVTPKPDVITRIFVLFQGVSEDELEEWTCALGRVEEGVDQWQDIVGVDKIKMLDTSLFRVLEWGGTMEVK